MGAGQNPTTDRVEKGAGARDAKSTRTVRGATLAAEGDAVAHASGLARKPERS